MADKLRQKLIEKLQSQIETIVSESVDEVVKEEDISEDELAELLHRQMELKPIQIKQRKTSGEKKKPKSSIDGYNKLPQDESEMIDWMRKLIKKRKDTKLGDEKDADKIFNVVTQRFLKRSSCLNRKGCTLREVNFEGDVIGFTEGGVSPKLEESDQFKNFIKLFEKKNEENPSDFTDLIIQKLEEKPRTMAELRKIVGDQDELERILEILQDKIEIEGKLVKLLNEENEKDVTDEDEDEEP